MSATVIGCGHTSHLNLFSIDVIVASPQVHLHFLTKEKEEYKELGYGKVEIVCHGCGESLLVYYMDDNHNELRLQVRDEFVHRHIKCPNRQYEMACPDWRTSFKVMDLRRAPPLRWKTVPLRRKRGEKTRFVQVLKPTQRIRKATENG